MDNQLTQRTRRLEEQIIDPHSIISIDCLLDSLNALIYDSEGVKKTKNFDTFYTKFHNPTQEVRQRRINFNDFESIKIIGRGAFGTVDLVRQKLSGQLYAMKTLSKFEMLKRSDSAFFWEERNIMAFADSQWIVKLHYAFQDVKNLYMIMDYMPGGDLITFLERNEITESAARFYCAEVVLGLDAIHSMGYVHRDIKPDNMLLDARGHLKLADFGTCVKMDKDGLVKSETAVGTPDYISPEILKSQSTLASYGREVDWWSVGVFLYEMLFGETPFYAESLVGTYHKIMNHRDNLIFPEDIPISLEARSLISAFLTDRTTRLGKNGIGDIKIHPYFTNHNEWTWENLRKISAPITLTIINDEDTSNFNEIDKHDRIFEETFSNNKAFVGNQLSFIGFSFSNEQQPFLNRYSTNNANTFNSTEIEQRLQENERQRNELENRIRRLNESLNTKCQEEQILNSKVLDLERKSIVLATQSQEAQRKYELELDNRQACERNLEEVQRSLEYERQTKNQIGATNREWMEKLNNLERQFNEVNEKFKLELDTNHRLRKLNQDLQTSYNNLEFDYNESNDKYQELNHLKLKIERDFLSQQTNMELESNAKNMALEKIQQLEERYNTMTIELSKIKEREVLQVNELTELRQSLTSLEREKVNLQVEIDSLRGKLSDEETRHKKAHEQLLVEKLKQATTAAHANHHSEEIIKDLEKKLDAERTALKKSHDELIESQQKIRVLEIDYKELSNNYNQIHQDHQAFEQLNEQIQLENQRRIQYDKELKQLQQQFNQSQQKEKQTQEQRDQIQNENERLSKELRQITSEYQIMKNKIRQLEEQIEADRKSSELSRKKIKEFKDEISELTDQLRSINDEQKNLEDERDNLAKQLEITNVKLKSESLNLNLLLEKCAESEKEKKILQIELDGVQKEFNTRCNLLDSELNTFRDQYEISQNNLQQANEDREIIVRKYNQLNTQFHELELQIGELRKKLDDERAKKEAAVNKLQEVVTQKNNPFLARTMSGIRRQNRDRNEHNQIRRLEQALQEERVKYKHLQIEKDEEIAMLTDDVNKLKREFEIQRDEMEKFKRSKYDLSRSTDSLSRISERGDDDTRDILQNWVQIPKENVKKNAWKKQYAVLTKHRFLLYNSERDQHAIISIDLNKLIYVRAVNQPDVLHVRPEMLSLIFQIMYDEQEMSIGTLPLSSSLPSHEHVGETIEYRNHSFSVMTMRSKKDCDICHHSTFKLFSPRALLQCSRCGILCHKQHYDDQEPILPCKVSYNSSTHAKSLLIMCNSDSEQRQWIDKLSKRLPRVHNHQDDSSKTSRSNLHPLENNLSSSASNIFTPTNSDPIPQRKTLTLPTRAK